MGADDKEVHSLRSEVVAADYGETAASDGVILSVIVSLAERFRCCAYGSTTKLPSQTTPVQDLNFSLFPIFWQYILYLTAIVSGR